MGAMSWDDGAVSAPLTPGFIIVLVLIVGAIWFFSGNRYAESLWDRVLEFFAHTITGVFSSMAMFFVVALFDVPKNYMGVCILAAFACGTIWSYRYRPL